MEHKWRDWEVEKKAIVHRFMELIETPNAKSIEIEFEAHIDVPSLFRYEIEESVPCTVKKYTTVVMDDEEIKAWQSEKKQECEE